MELTRPAPAHRWHQKYIVRMTVDSHVVGRPSWRRLRATLFAMVMSAGRGSLLSTVGALLVGGAVGVGIAEARRKTLIVGPLRARRRLHLGAHPPQLGDVVFLGDSLVHGAEWAVQYPELRVRNFGIAGDTTSDVLERLGDIGSSRPSVVALMIGTNDVTRGSRPADTVDGIMTIVRELKDASPNTAVLVHTLLPRQRRYRRWIGAVNEGVRQSVLPLADELIDLHPVFVDARGRLRPELSNDRLHLLPCGYTLWKEHLSPVLEHYASR